MIRNLRPQDKTKSSNCLLLLYLIEAVFERCNLV